MSSVIPFFYADLIARIIPGTVCLALLRLTTLKPPSEWSNFISGTSPAHTVILPLVYAGLAYLIGTVLETILNRWLENAYICAFKSVSREYPWTGPKAPAIGGRSAKNLSRATIGYLLVLASEKEVQAVSQINRFHSEAKMCHTIFWILIAFLLLVLPFRPVRTGLLANPATGAVALLGAFALLLALLCVTWERQRSRARFVFRTIDRLGSDGHIGILRQLRSELQALTANSMPSCSVWKKPRCWFFLSHHNC